MKLFSKKNPQSEKVQSEQEAERIINEGMATIRDILAPAAVQVEYSHIRLGGYFLRSFFVYSYPRYLYTEWLSPVINADFAVDTSMFIYPINSKEIMQKLRTKSAQIQSIVTEQQEKGLVRDPLLETAAEDVEELRDTIQRGEAKFFKCSLYFTLYTKTLKELDSLTSYLENLLGGQLVLTKQAFLQQEQGFNSSMPLCKDELLITKNLDTSALSTFFPFISSDLSQNEGILYGINRHTNGLVIFDRFSLENANEVVLAKSGSGKSYVVKLEILRYLMFDSEVIVIDPENEYEKLCEALGGTYLNISINANSRINPFDLPRISDEDTDEEGEDHLRSNIIMLHGLIRIMLGGEMNPTEDNLLDQALIQAYVSKGITSDPKSHVLPPPMMGDLVKILSSIKGAERIAASLEKYTSGAFSGIFNQETNIGLDSKLIVFSIRDLEDELRPMAMYMILNYIWNKVKSDRKKRILAVDEAWILMKHEDSAQFLYSIAKRARKYYLGLSTIVQDVEDFLTSTYGKAIINNSSISVLLKQHPAAVDLVTKVFNLTQAEKYYLLNSEVGEGLFFAGLNHIAIKIVASYQEDLMITTNPEQLNEIES